MGKCIDISAKKDFKIIGMENVLLFGSEGYGLRAKTLENSDFKFKKIWTIK